MARPKKQFKLKEPIKIRLKSLADGNKSIYLDIYYKGVRKYEYLKLYLVPEINPVCKEQNRLSGNLVGISINLCKSIQKELFINDTS